MKTLMVVVLEERVHTTTGVLLVQMAFLPVCKRHQEPQAAALLCCCTWLVQEALRANSGIVDYGFGGMYRFDVCCSATAEQQARQKIHGSKEERNQWCLFKGAWFNELASTGGLWGSSRSSRRREVS